MVKPSHYLALLVGIISGIWSTLAVLKLLAVLEISVVLLITPVLLLLFSAFALLSLGAYTNHKYKKEHEDEIKGQYADVSKGE